MQESHIADEPKNRLEHMMDHLKDYISTSFDIVKLKMVEKGVSVVSGLIATIASAVMFLFALVFLSIGLAWYLSTRLQSPYYGFLIVGGLYLFLGIIIVAAKKSLVETPMSNAIIKQVFKEEKE
jgi:hypothetical protein